MFLHIHAQAKLISIPIYPALVVGLFFAIGLVLFPVFQFDNYSWAKWLWWSQATLCITNQLWNCLPCLLWPSLHIATVNDSDFVLQVLMIELVFHFLTSPVLLY